MLKRFVFGLGLGSALVLNVTVALAQQSHGDSNQAPMDRRFATTKSLGAAEGFLINKTTGRAEICGSAERKSDAVTGQHLGAGWRELLTILLQAAEDRQVITVHDRLAKAGDITRAGFLLLGGSAVRLLRERDGDVECKSRTQAQSNYEALQHSSPSDVMRGGEPREEVRLSPI